MTYAATEPSDSLMLKNYSEAPILDIEFRPTCEWVKESTDRSPSRKSE